jgi:hypothetical protein
MTVNECENPNPSAWQIADLHIREVLGLELKARDAALQLQALEYERRLQTLNHENARILEAASKSVSLERFEAAMALQAVHNEQTRTFIDRFEAATEQLRLSQERFARWVAIIGAVLAILTFALRFL